MRQENRKEGEMFATEKFANLWSIRALAVSILQGTDSLGMLTKNIGFNVLHS